MSANAEGVTDYRLARVQNLLGERYEFLTLLGRGGAASVFEVKNLRLGRVEALKILSEEPGEEHAKRFQHEARVAASLDHPNIVRIYDFGIAGEIPWYTMQLVDGPSLSALLHDQGRMDATSAARIAAPVLDALEYSHSRGVIHRDVKPANVLVDPGGRPHLADFGVAKSVESLLKTRTGLVVGTPAYVSPEQARGDPVDARTDLYAMGVMLYQMLSGEFPFEGENPLQVVLMRLHSDPEPLISRCPDIPPEIAEVVTRAMARDKAKRHGSAALMRSDLIAACEGLGLPWDRPFSCPPGACAVRKPMPSTGLPHPYVPPGVAGDTATDALSRASDASPPGPGTAPRRTRRRAWLYATGAAVTVLAAAAVLTAPLWMPRDDPGAAPGVSAAPSPDSARPSPDQTDKGGTPSEAGTVPGPVEERSGAGQTGAVAARREPPPPPSAREPRVRRPVTPAQLQESFRPELPAGVPGACAGAKIPLSVRVGEDGLVKEARLLAPAEPACAQAALEAGRKFRFTPALDSEGRPVEAATAVSVEFPEVP
jgi:serine/threonine-protein kinase